MMPETLNSKYSNITWQNIDGRGLEQVLDST